MISRKKGRTPKVNQWQSNTALWVGKSYKDTLLPKHVFLSVIIHVIFFVAFVNFSKYYILNHIKPVVKNIEFNLPKTAKRIAPKPLPQNTVAESPAASQENATPQEQPHPANNSPKAANNKDSHPTKKTSSNAAATSTSTAESFDDDFIPMSKIKRSASSFSKSFSGTSGASEEASGGGSATSTSQGGIKGSKEVTGYDISPYVNELRRNIKMNWKVPSSSPSKRVELFLRIARDGRVMILNVKTTSESAALDESTLEAVRRATPIRPIPSKYPKNYLDIVFSFYPADGSVR